MNLNSTLITKLGTATGLPVAQDEYDGSADKYIVFTYADERPDAFADNQPTADQCLVQVQLITPKSFNYMNLKHLIRNALEELGTVETIRSFLGDPISGTEKIRQTVFEARFVESRTVNI